MEILKTTYEIRYPKILTFNEIYKDIINPYFGYSNAQYSISDEGRHSESIVLTFPDSESQLSFSFERVSFQYNNDPRNLTKNGSLLDEMSLKIFRELKKLKPFLKASVEVVHVYGFLEINSDDIIKEFTSPLKVDFIDEVREGLITLEIDGEGHAGSLQYGPFSPEKDIENYRLFPFDDYKRLDFSRKRGIIVACTILRKVHLIKRNSVKGSDKYIDVSKKTFGSLLDKCESYIEQIFANYEHLNTHK